jgi:D-alanyl-lipoteichoic acid acyltransferase DltB (MBOAT superfamily)
MINFRQPYFSQTVREFWTRWHISLSRWIRDYVYTPLAYRTGINKLGRNLFITMALCGLWHGATWNFVLWGIFFGLLQWVEWPLLVRRGEDFPGPPQEAKQWPGTLLRMALVFHLVCLAWILFRAPDLGSAWGYITHLLSGQHGTRVSIWGIPLILLAVSMDIPAYLAKNQLVLLKMPRWALGLGYVGIIILLFLFAGQSLPFIYFKF